MLPQVLAVGLVASAASGAQIDRYSIGQWTIRVTRDRFTGQVSCVAARRRITVERGLVIFNLGRRADTADAFFRLDLGPAHPVADFRRDVQLAGFKPQNTSLENPSGGVVALPLSVLVGVRRIDIRATPKDRPQGFALDGLDAVTPAETRLGCPPR